MLGGAAALAAIALLVLAGVAVHELRYADAHPYAYGPAKEIAMAAAGGALLAGAVLLLAASAWRALR